MDTERQNRHPRIRRPFFICEMRFFREREDIPARRDAHGLLARARPIDAVHGLGHDLDVGRTVGHSMANGLLDEIAAMVTVGCVTQVVGNAGEIRYLQGKRGWDRGHL